MENEFLPISCRFLPNDQWLTTQLDSKWKIIQVKVSILARCSPALALHIDPPRPRPASPITFAPHPYRRSISPITFAPSSHTNAALEDPDLLDADDLAQTAYDYEYEHDPSKRHRPQKHSLSLSIAPHHHPPPSMEPDPPPSTAAARLAAQFTLIRFATGQILEDEFALSWYALRPHELLELHRTGVVIRLPRATAPEYARPYFDARVLALRAAYSKPDDRPQHPHRRADLKWSARWLVIREGVFKLCKDGSVSPSQDTARTHFPLNALLALRGAEHIARVAPAAPGQRIVCCKFLKTRKAKLPPADHKGLRRPPSSTNLNTGPYLRLKTKSPPPSHGMPKGARPMRTVTEGEGAARRWSIDSGERGEAMGPAQVLSGESEVDDDESGADGADAPEDMQDDLFADEAPRDDARGQWIVLELRDDDAYASLLRVLHRAAPRPLRSSFLPALPSPLPSPGARFEVPYPEWRVAVVHRAVYAGLGAAGRALEFVLCGAAHPPEPACEHEDGEDGEAEWEGWMGDLARQRRPPALPAGGAYAGLCDAPCALQEERRALEPTGVVTCDCAADPAESFASTHTVRTVEAFFSGAGPVPAGGEGGMPMVTTWTGRSRAGVLRHVRSGYGAALE